MGITMRYGVILGIICILAGGLLAGMNNLTKPIIIARQLEEERKSLLEVLPQAQRFEPVKDTKGELLFYKAYDKDNKPAGFAFKAQGRGYSSIIETMVGVDTGEKISAIKVINQNETPGLGTRIARLPFTSQFMGRNAEDLSGVQAIAGATVSSKAIIDSVKNKLEEIKKLLLKNEK